MKGFCSIDVDVVLASGIFMTSECTLSTLFGSVCFLDNGTLQVVALLSKTDGIGKPLSAHPVNRKRERVISTILFLDMRNPKYFLMYYCNGIVFFVKNGLFYKIYLRNDGTLKHRHITICEIILNHRDGIEMKKIIHTLTLVSATATALFAGGEVAPAVEPSSSVPQKEVVVVSDQIKYDGFYLGGALSYMQMNEAVLASGHAITLAGGYYFNKYFGIEGRYTRTLTDLDIDNGSSVVSRDDVMSNLGLYIKPMFNLTTGFSLYGLAGYGKSTYEKHGIEYSESGLQWGLGAKYELANGVGLFVDYMELYNDDNYDGIVAEDLLFNTMNVGATYTF